MTVQECHSDAGGALLTRWTIWRTGVIRSPVGLPLVLRQTGGTCAFTFSPAEPNTRGSGKAVNHTLSVVQRLQCKEVSS